MTKTVAQMVQEIFEKVNQDNKVSTVTNMDFKLTVYEKTLTIDIWMDNVLYRICKFVLTDGVVTHIAWSPFVSDTKIVALAYVYIMAGEEKYQEWVDRNMLSIVDTEWDINI